MADTLYLSLWYPNLRLPELPSKLTAVLDAFAAHGGEKRVYSATVWPINWNESPVFQQIYGRRVGTGGDGTDVNGPVELGAEPRLAVDEALELLHDDFACEFQIGWSLGELETGGSLDARWKQEPRLVRGVGFGPLFEEGTYEADGHIRVDFGSGAPFRGEGIRSHCADLVERVGREPGSAAGCKAINSGWGSELTVRLTIEKLRTLVLGAAILLLVALGLFLAVGKIKNPFNRRDLPQRLGIEIQQEANGVTYTQAHGGRTLFKIHASKVVQLKQGNAMLHDVKIELYGEDGTRVDRIEGGDFEYNQQAGIAVAAGPVDITLMQPGVAPAIAPKAAAGQGLGGKVKGAPVASAAQTAARGEIHVKTRGLIFNQNSGVATTSQHVDFSMVQGAGSSMGATYDSDSGLLVLDHAVELTTKRGTQTVQIHSQHAEFERQSQLCRLREATADYQGGEAKAGDAKVLFRQDGSAVRLDAMNWFTLATSTGSHLASPSGHMEFDEHNQPRHGHMEGGVTMDSVSEAAGRHRQMHGTSPTAELEFNAQGQLRHAHMERGVTMDSQEQGEQAGQQLRLSRHWRSPIADVEFRDSGRGQLEPSTVHGTGGVVVTGESQRGQGAVVPSRLSAGGVTGMLGPHSVLTGLNGVGHASIDETTETGTRQTTSGDRRAAHFATTPAVKRGPGS